MMIIPNLEMNQPVGETIVKSSYQTITKPAHLELIRESILIEVASIDAVLPTISPWEEYVYNDVASAILATEKMLKHAIEGKILPRKFLRFLRRLFIVSGKCVDDSEFNTMLVEMFHLAKYKEENEDEM